MSLGENILDHYNQFLGDYIGADVYTDNDYEIQILGFPNAIKDSLVFASFGLSKYGQGNCCEVILPVDDLYDECAEIFANSLFYALSNNMSIDRGLLIEGADSIIEGFSEKCGKTALYFTDVYFFPEEFSFVDNKFHIYIGFFVSKEESEYIKKYGSEQFEDLLEGKEVDVIDIKRKSIL